jgi:hypothetical protein
MALAKNITKPKGVQLNTANEVRVFAHDAVGLTAAQIATGTYVIPDTEQRGSCIYVGVAMTSISVIMESGNSVIFKGVTAGSFLPILVTSVTAAVPASGTLADNDIVVLY